jgi:hypothetical protein
MHTEKQDIEHQATVEGLTEFTCRKKVYSSPMSRGGYLEYFTLLSDAMQEKAASPKDGPSINASDEGYLVIYDFKKPTEYRSWSPKGVFDDGYKPSSQQSNPIDKSGIIQHFQYDHLPDTLKVVSRPICDLAQEMNAYLEPGAEKDAGLRKLLEAKDCLVRAIL